MSTTDSFYNKLFNNDNGYINTNNIISLNRKSFIEKFDKNKLAYILLNKEEFKKINYRDNARDLPILEDYYFNSNDDGEIEVIYKDNSYDKLYGRYYADKSISAQGMMREVRHVIYDDYYIDLDIVNAHPVFLKWLCNNNNIKCDLLTKYIDDRENIIKDIISRNENIDREIVKNTFLSIINGGCGKLQKLKKNKFLDDFKKELTNIHNEICDKFKTIYSLNIKIKQKQKKDLWNIKASTVNKMLCFIENQCLMIIHSYFNENYDKDMIEKSILCFDGIMLPKFLQNDINKDIKKLERIFEDNGLILKLKVKDMEPCNISLVMDYDPNMIYVFEKIEDNEVNILEDEIKEDEIKEEIIQKNYFDEKDDYYYSDFMNEIVRKQFKEYYQIVNFIKINLPRVMTFVNEYIYIKKNENNLYDLNSLHKLNLNYKFGFTIYNKNGDVERIIESKLIDIIINNSHLFNIYRSVKDDFDFKNINNNQFIISRKFIATKLENYDISKIDEILNFIKEIWCDGDEIVYNYLIKWFAFMVKFPHLKSKKAVILYSKEQQIGKGSIITFLCEFVFGKYNTNPNINGLDDLLNKNNYILQGKKLVGVNELSTTKDDFHSSFNKLKSYITDDDIVIKKLYHDTYNAKQLCEFIFCSNNELCFNVENSDRRYLLLKCNGKYHGDNYLNEFNDRIKNQDVGDHFYTYLLNQIQSPKDFYNLELPETQYKKDLKELNKNNVELFYDFMLEIENGEDKDFNYPTYHKNGFKALDLYKYYQFYCCEIGEKPFSNKYFGVHAKNLWNKKKSGCLFYIWK